MVLLIVLDEDTISDITIGIKVSIEAEAISIMETHKLVFLINLLYILHRCLLLAMVLTLNMVLLTYLVMVFLVLAQILEVYL